MKLINVETNEAGQRLDKLLIKILNKAPKSFIYKMLRKKNIVLNGKKADGSEKLMVQDEIKMFLSEETIEQFSEIFSTTEVEHNLNILYEDQHILILDKPLGMLSQKAEIGDISIVEHIISYMLSTNQITKEQLNSFKPGVCNRLDRNTSGIMIAGKSLLGLQEMARLLKDRSLEKYYLCIVKGRIDRKKRIEGYLNKDEDRNKVKISKLQTEDTEYICTEYEPLLQSEYHADTSKDMTRDSIVKASKSRDDAISKLTSQEEAIEQAEDGPQGNYTLLQVKLITGRSHQIRAHLASINHPLIGDFKYGDQRTNHYFKKNFGLTHQLLHSYKMKFPVIEGELSYLSGKEFQAELPELFEQIKKDVFER